MMRDQKILRVVTKLQIPFVLVFGFYVLTHGELGPGGGFQAGVILGAGFILYGLVFGIDAKHRVLPRKVTDILAGLGVLLYVGVGTVNMLSGHAFLNYAAITPDAPADGEAWGMTLVEYGVGITVAAVMITLFNAFVHGAVESASIDDLDDDPDTTPRARNQLQSHREGITGLDDPSTLSPVPADAGAQQEESS